MPVPTKSICCLSICVLTIDLALQFLSTLNFPVWREQSKNIKGIHTSCGTWSLFGRNPCKRSRRRPSFWMFLGLPAVLLCCSKWSFQLLANMSSVVSFGHILPTHSDFIFFTQLLYMALYGYINIHPWHLFTRSGISPMPTSFPESGQEGLGASSLSLHKSSISKGFVLHTKLGA